MRDVAVIGVGCTRFGEKWESSFRDLFVEAGALALEDAQLYRGKYRCDVCRQHECRTVHRAGAYWCPYCGLRRYGHTPYPFNTCRGRLRFRRTCFPAGCDRGGKRHGGYRRRSRRREDDRCRARASTDALTGAADREWEGFVGATFPGLYAMIATDYMHKYSMTREQLAQVAVKNHYNGARNPIAQFQQEITLETVMRSTMVAEPLRSLTARHHGRGSSRYRCTA